MPEKFYLTTPIYYVNARPHIGHAYTTIVADVLARRSRAQGVDTWFLTGTDEHGQKIERSAAAAGIPPQQFADKISAQFRTLWDRMGLTYNQYIRTTDKAHKRGVQKLFTTLQQNGHIYLDSYTGAYCVSDETFVDVPTGTPCPDCGRPTETVTEENYFFRLSNFQLPLLNLIESNTLQIEPDSRRNEVLSFLRGGLKDLSISRSSFTWGIPVPTSLPLTPAPLPLASHVIYVWLDALANYMTAVGYGSEDPADIAKFAKYWPADLHIVGKEIIRFHCVYWPAFLLAANLPTPQKIVAHGWLLFDDAKMSKSKGNIVRTETILEAFGTLCPPPPPNASFTRPDEAHSLSPSLLPLSSFWRSQNLSISPEAPQPSSALLKGTASAVPQTTPEEPAALAAEVRSPSAPPQPPSPPTAVILDEVQNPRISSGAPQPLSVSLKGTASAVPQTTPEEPAALAAEVRSPSAPPQPPSPPTAVILDEVQNPRISPDPPQPSKHDRDLFAADVLRYFLLREIPFGQDGSFSFEALITRYNADLANGYGNLVSRTLTMIYKYFDGRVPDPEAGEQGDFTRNRLMYHTELLSRRTDEERQQDIDAFDLELVASLFGSLDFSTLLERIARLISSTDNFLTSVSPWKPAAGLESLALHRWRAATLYSAFEDIRIITALLHPILPYATASVWRQLGLGDIEQAAKNGDLMNLQWGGLQPGTRLGPLSPIFPRIEKKDIPNFIQRMTDMESPTPLAAITAQHDAATPAHSDLPTATLASEVAASPVENHAPTDPAAGPRTSTLPEPNPGSHVAASAALTTERPDPTQKLGAPFMAEPHPAMSGSTSESSSPPDASPQITIEDFAKIELRVAQVVVAERIPKADKLLRLEVDLGYERRQILSGIAEWYTPEDLLGRRIIVITNLAPRKMRGLESHGMLLAASTDGGKPHLATIDSPDLPLGSRLK